MRRGVQHATLVIGTAVLTALATVLMMQTALPPGVTARSAQADEVRASAFLVVGQDGTVLARLGPDPAGNGNLAVFDSSGKRRVLANGGGAIVVLDGDGMTQRLGIAALGGNAGMGVYDREGTLRLTFGVGRGIGYSVVNPNGSPLAALGTDADGAASLRINDAEGSPLVVLP